MSDNFEDTFSRIKTHKSVQGIVIVNNTDGRIMRSFYQKGDEGENIAKSIPQLTQKAKSAIRDLDPTNDLTFLRIKTKNNEIMVAPDKELTMIVWQVKNDKNNDNE